MSALTLTAHQIATDLDLALAEVINFDMLQCGWVAKGEDWERFAARLFGAKSDCLAVSVVDNEIHVWDFDDGAMASETIFRGAPSVIIARATALAVAIIDAASDAR